MNSAKKTETLKKCRTCLAIVFLLCVFPQTVIATESIVNPWDALERVEMADAETRELSESILMGKQNMSVFGLIYGCSMATVTVDDPERYKADWAENVLAEIRRHDTKDYLGSVGGNFVRNGWPWSGGIVRAAAEGLSIHEKESFVASGGLLVWSGGPSKWPVVNTDYINMKDNSATFKAGIWYDLYV